VTAQRSLPQIFGAGLRNRITSNQLLQHPHPEGQRTFIMYLTMTHPWEFDGTVGRRGNFQENQDTVLHTGSGAYAYTSTSSIGSVRIIISRTSMLQKAALPMTGAPDQPFHQHHERIIRWYDHWLKGQNTGIWMSRQYSLLVPWRQRVANRTDWPPPETQWTKVLSLRMGNLYRPTTRV
jgi:hypothetical protein